MIYCQGMYGWEMVTIRCSECDYEIVGLHRDEIDTGRGYYADATADILDKPCPECGAKMGGK